MKDYRLSEIKKHCEEMYAKYGTQACKQCYQNNLDLHVFCVDELGKCPSYSWGDIEPRCLVELPCKIGDKLYGLKEEWAMERLHPYSLNRKGVFEYTVSMITIKKDNTVVIRLTYYNPWRECKVSIDVDELRVYGYNLHKTREEAEAELKGEKR